MQMPGLSSAKVKGQSTCCVNSYVNIKIQQYESFHTQYHRSSLFTLISLIRHQRQSIHDITYFDKLLFYGSKIYIN